MKSPLPRKQLLDFFHHSLSSFQSSPDSIRILSTLPHHNASSPSSRPPTRHPSRLIILDSSYNPPTVAHEAMIKSALHSALTLEKSRGVPDGTPAGSSRVMLLLAISNADKAPKPASFPHRLCMMEAFGQDIVTGWKAGELEVDLAVTKVPYFHEKSLAISESGIYGAAAAANTEQVFLAGFDTLIRVFNPKYYESGMQTALGPLFAASRLRVTMREDDEWGSKEDQRAYLEKLRAGALEEVGGRVDWVERVDMVDGDEGRGVSSSRVREVVQRGEDAGSIVSKEIKAWIDEEGLYAD